MREMSPPARVTASPSSDPDSGGEIASPVVVPTIAPVSVALPPVLSGRAQMEQERLERQKARAMASGKPSTTPAAASGSTPIPTIASGSRSPTGPSVVKTIADLDTDSKTGSSGSASTSRPRPVASGSSSRPRVSSHHPLQSSGPFPSDAAGEYYLDGELRHTALTIGKPTDAPTFSPKQVVGKVSLSIISRIVVLGY